MDRSPLLLAVVLGLHVFASWLLSRRWVRPGADRMWAVVLLTFLQWGTLATVLSLAHALTPTAWLMGLGLITAAALAAARGPASRSSLRPDRRRRTSMPFVFGLTALALLIAAAFVVQWRIPLHKGDDLMYHAGP